MISRLKFGRAVLFLTIYMGIFTAVLKFIGLGLFSAQNIITIIFFLSFILLISQGIIKIESKIEVIFLYYFGVKLILNLIQYSDNFTNINDFLVVVNFYFLLKFFLSLNEQSKISIIKGLDNYFIIISAIVISQFFFSNILPTAFTELPNTKEAAYAADGYFRATDEGVVFRPNGLVGNPLELGLLLNIFLYMRFYFRENVFTYRGTILIILNIILILILNSRANTILALIVTLYWGLKKRRNIKKIILLIPTVIFLMVTYFYAYINLLFKRIISQDPYAIASTIEHINDYISALNYISSKPLFGYSRSFVIENEIITDGGIFILILRHGIIGLLFFISVIYRKRIWTNITVPCILLLLSSIFNSTILSSVNFYFIAILMGLSFQTKWKT